jgi:SAM-dependent methyltransferase
MTEATEATEVTGVAVVRTCESCGAPELADLFRSPRTGLRVGRCRDCRLVSVLDQPGERELAEHYASAPRYALYLAAQRSEALHGWRLRTLARLRTLLGVPAADHLPRLFDVGAGGGDFLALARSGGFEVAGNELSEPARALCAERHGIDLHLGDLRGIEGSEIADAMTMWCVVAHVAHPQALLRDALRLLRPGGILYLHTPRWCLLDSVGVAALRGTGGRLSQLSDRRTNLAHLRLYSVDSMTRTLRAVGFQPVSVRPAVGYSLQTDAYLRSMDVPHRLRRPLAAGLDGLIGRGVFVRNILEVYARKPASAA